MSESIIMDAEAPNISSTDLERALPEEFCGVDFNFCRDPQCSRFAEHPYPFKIEKTDPLPEGFAVRADVSRNYAELRHKCPECWATTAVKNNRAIFEEYDRQRRLRIQDPNAPGCKNDACVGRGRALTDHPDQYRSYGKTKAGDPRHQCKLCRKTFSIGRPARRHKRSDKNKAIFEMLVNDTALSKICILADISYSALYEKIDYIYQRVRAFTASREKDLSSVPWEEVGSRFATDSQSLVINWPTKRKRTPVVVQHLCTAHAISGYIIAASIQFDPSMRMSDIEAQMIADGDFEKPIPFRNQSRAWCQTDFEAHLAALQADNPEKIVPEFYQLPHEGVLVRADIMQFAHAMIVRDAIKNSKARFMFVMDREDSIRLAFVSVMADLIKDRDAQIAVVSFSKGMTNDKRNQVVADGRALLRAVTGKTAEELDALSNQDFADLLDSTVAPLLAGKDLITGVTWPFHNEVRA